MINPIDFTTPSATIIKFIENPVNWLAVGFLSLVALTLFIVIVFGIYLYLSLALYSLAKKEGYDKLWLAWVPFAQIFLLAIVAGKTWYWGFLFFIPFFNVVFLTICLWEILEKKGFDGKWSLVVLAGLAAKPFFISATFLSVLIIIGILAWKKIA